MKNIKIDEIRKINRAHYTALYLSKTKKILKNNNIKNVTILRYTHFHKDGIYACGISHAMQILKKYRKDIEVWGVKDGEFVKPGKPILVIKGYYPAIAETESVIDGIIARESSVCTKCKRILKLIKSDQLIFMADRADLYLTQAYDGYAAHVAGVTIFTTPAHVDLLDNKNAKVVGTMPHALIQQHNGNLNEALWSYHRTYKNELLSPLVDYHNDIVHDIKSIDNDLKPFIKSIRIDTSSSMIDKSLKNYKGVKNGVTSALVFKARQALDKSSMKHVKIVVSSGFDEAKITSFIKDKTPVDFYGIGSSLVKVDVNITCDLVYLNGKPQAKTGRSLGILTKDLKTLNKYI